MAIRTRLRIHLVGQTDVDKVSMASELRAAINRRRRMDFVVVPNLVDKVKERFPFEDVSFFMALESEYLRFEAERDTKAKHLVFVDSIVDRFLRMEKARVNLAMYFMPRMRSSAQQPGQLFLYGPKFDEERSEFLAKNRIHAQLWSGKSECAEELAEAALIALRSKDGK